MARRIKKPINNTEMIEIPKIFNIEFLNEAQKIAYETCNNPKNQIVFLLGPAGCGKTHIAVAYAVEQLIKKRTSKLLLARPLVECGESIGILPGDIVDKTSGFFAPIKDIMDSLLGNDVRLKGFVENRMELSPLALMRGKSFNDSLALLDEAQNSSRSQLKLFLSRLGRPSGGYTQQALEDDKNPNKRDVGPHSRVCKLILSGDPKQSDIARNSALIDVYERIKDLPGIGSFIFDNSSIVRNPLIGQILDRLEA